MAVENAIANLSKKCTAYANGEPFGVRRLYPVAAWVPFKYGSSSGLVAMGEDDCGNYFLYSQEGSILFWDHETSAETLLARDLITFLDSLSAPISFELQPGQVEKVWIDPAFFEDQRRKGNA